MAKFHLNLPLSLIRLIRRYSLRWLKS